MPSPIRPYFHPKWLKSLSHDIGKPGLSNNLSPNDYSKGYAFNHINFTAFVIGLLRLFLITILLRQTITPKGLVINALPVFCCAIMMGSMVAELYLFTIYFSFLALPFVLFFIIFHEHDRGLIAFFIPYLIYPVYFLNRKWKIIASFSLSASFLIASFTVEAFHEHPPGSHTHNIPIEVFSLTGALVLCFITLYSIKFQAWQFERKILRQKMRLEMLNLTMRKEKEKLYESNKVKDKLFSIISHDLRITIQNLYLLMDENDDEASLVNFTENMPELRIELKKTSKLFDDLLDWSRLQMRGNGIMHERIDVAKIAANVKGTLHYRAREKDIEVNIRIYSPFLYGDSDMIEIVLRNLVSNAVKFTKDRGTISITGRLEENSYVLQVNDTGIGIEPTNMDKILRHDFYSSYGTNYEIGTGLGLFICRDLLEKCQGHLILRSIPGKGTQAEIWLPKQLKEPSVNQRQKWN